MAEDDGKSGKSKFKSKWGRVFKEKEEHEQTPNVANNFKLDDDVTAFLKPSTDKAASTRSNFPAPKLDIAIAQRWPDANEVLRPSANTASDGSDFPPNGFTKPKRRKGLTVGFVKAVPEIIGEGGDEAEDPPTEVSRQKARMARSRSERQPAAAAQQQRQPPAPMEGVEGVQPRRRAETSVNEFSPPVQRKHFSPSPQAEQPPRQVIARTPTRKVTQDEMPPPDSNDSDRDDGPPQVQLDTRFTEPQRLSPGPKNPNALAVRKKELRSGEGMAFRRASAMIYSDDEARRSAQFGYTPSQQQYDTLSQPEAQEQLMADTRAALAAPRSAASPEGPSPFDDPKYIKRHSREAVPQVQEPPQPPPPRQQRAPYEPSYMRAAKPPPPPQPPPSHPLPARPQIPEVRAPPDSDEDEPSPHQNEQPTYMRKVQPPDSAQNMRPPVPPSHSRDPSPVGGRLYGTNSHEAQRRQFYSRPNGSNTSHHSHSRSSSREEGSPRQVSPGFGLQHPASSYRVQTHSPSPQSGSPRSDILGRPPLSPSSRDQSPGSVDYFGALKPQGPRPAAGHLQVESPSSRPGSAASGRSLQQRPGGARPPPPPEAWQSSLGSAEATGRPPASSTGSARQRPDENPAPNRGAPPGSSRSAAAKIQQEDARRPSSASSGMYEQAPMGSPQPSSEGNPAAEAAYADFSARVAHMKGVFRLTAEKERAADRCPPPAWLRTALWWYLRGKSGLEVLLQQNRPRDDEGHPRELLTQPHVDLAKAWWILSDPLEEFDTVDEATPQRAPSSPDVLLGQSLTMLKSHLKSLSLSMTRSQLMPPPQSLIQGQDTTIWLEYPRFNAQASEVLGGMVSKSAIADPPKQGLQPLEALPIGDMRDMHCYGRFRVDVSMGTEEESTDRVSLPCILTITRGKRDFSSTIVIASQSELVTVKIVPRQSNERGLTWQDVSWKASSSGMVVRLPHGYDLTVRMQDRDFRWLWNLVEYSRKVEHSLRADAGETGVHESRLAEMQYADSSKANSFPQEKVRGALALVFERTIPISSGGEERKAHRGFRLLLVTDPKNKSLASTSHEVCSRDPLLFEFITDSAAHGMAAMVVRVREENRQVRVLLVFPDVSSRQNFYDVLNGLTVSAEETIVGNVNVTGMNIEPASHAEGSTRLAHPALQALQWQKLGITNGAWEEDVQSNVPGTVESDRLRIVARHATGCITDRLNLGKGELLLRIPCVNAPAIQMLRSPQEDMGMSIDTRHAQDGVTNGIMELLRLVRRQPTVRTFTFASFDDLHAFQTAVTGSTVRYDSFASTLSISRRRMVVPIYKKWEATNVRLQVIAHGNVVQVLAFMEDFSHADALCFQVKSTDVFETVKGDAAKGKKWAVKMVDAKFSLPHQEGKGEEVSAEEKVRRRFVNLEGLDYAEEHDDITVGFETEEDRDVFARTLPAAATVSRGITLKRRI